MADRATNFAVRPDAFDPQPPPVASSLLCLYMDFDSFELTPTEHALMGEYMPANLDLSENTDVQTETEKDAEDNDDDLDSLFGPEVDGEPDHGNCEDSTPATAFTPSPLPFQAPQLRGEVAPSRGALPVKPGVVEQSLTTGAFGTDAKPPTLCLPTGQPVRGHTDRKSPSTASKRTAPRLALPAESRSARKPSPSPAAPATLSSRPSLPIDSARSSSTDVELELARVSGTSFAASVPSTPASATWPTSPEVVRRVAAADAQALRNDSRVQSVLRPTSPRVQRAAPPSTQATTRAVVPAASSHAQAQRSVTGPSVAFAMSGSPSGMTLRIPSVLLPAPQAAPSRDTCERSTLAASSTAQSGKRKRNATANTAAPASKRQAVKRGPPSSVASHPSMVQHLHRETSRTVAEPSRLSSLPAVPSNAPAPQHEAHSTIAARGSPVTAPAQLPSGSLVSPWSYSIARTRIQIPQPAKILPSTTTSVARTPGAAGIAKTHARVQEPPLRLPLQNRWGFYYPDE